MKVVKNFLIATFVIVMVACGGSKSNEVSLKVEADLEELGEYVTIEDKEAVVKLVESEEDIYITSSLSIKVKKSIASNSSFFFDAEVLDKDHVVVGDLLLAYEIDDRYELDPEGFSHVLFKGTKRAEMIDGMGMESWKDYGQEEWNKIREDGVYISIKTSSRAKYKEYKSSLSSVLNDTMSENDSDDDDSYNSSSSGSEDWDEVLQAYEEYVDKYIACLKKAAKGDLSAVSEYPALMEKAQEIDKKIEKAKGELSTAQWERYNKATLKMVEAAKQKQ